MRTDKPTESNRRHGLTQFLVPMDSPGITVRPIKSMDGAAELTKFISTMSAFLRITLARSTGSKQANRELAYERSGSERFLLFGVLQLLQTTYTQIRNHI